VLHIISDIESTIGGSLDTFRDAMGSSALLLDSRGYSAKVDEAFDAMIAAPATSIAALRTKAVADVGMGR
jgi:hypothetical protein